MEGVREGEGGSTLAGGIVVVACPGAALSMSLISVHGVTRRTEAVHGFALLWHRRRPPGEA